MAGVEAPRRFDRARATPWLLAACGVAAALTAFQATQARQDGVSPWAQAQPFERPGERP